MLLKYLLRKLSENDESCKVSIKVIKGYRELEGEILELDVKDIEHNKILLKINIGKDS